MNKQFIMLSEDIKPLFMGKWNTVCTMVERSCVSYTVFYSESMKLSIRTIYKRFTPVLWQVEHLFKDWMLRSMQTITEKKRNASKVIANTTLQYHQNLTVTLMFSAHHSWAFPLLKILARRETFDWALSWKVLLFSCAFWRFFLDMPLFLNRFRWISSSVERCL